MLHLLEDSDFRHEDVAFVGGDFAGKDGGEVTNNAVN